MRREHRRPAAAACAAAAAGSASGHAVSSVTPLLKTRKTFLETEIDTL